MPLLVLAAASLFAGRARADNILRHAHPGGTAGAASPDAASAAAAAQAEAAARQANSPLRQALEAIKQWQDVQAGARAAALGSPSDVPNGLGPGGLQLDPNSTQVGAGGPVQAGQGGRVTVTVTQTDPRAVLTWETFNVGRETDFHFDQTQGGDNASSWVALNRVNDPGAAPSRILGSIRAEGQVYIINRNGVIFSGTSQVNVGSLVVSGLDLAGSTLDQRNQRFLSGTLYDLSFAGPGGTVTVEAGAQIGISNFGRAVLLGDRVANGGSIEAPDGQVLLAAGSAISFLPPGDLSSVRGLQVPTVAGAGVVENTGLISTPRGNITLVAAETRQDGMLTATTGAQANGSIWLGQDGSITTLGGSSVTQILPDEGGKKLVGAADFKPSRVDVRGDKISLLDGATLYAPAGDVSLSAVMTVDPTGAGLDDTRVYLGSGARIDVSGLLGIVAPMEQNTIQAELRANELRDNPLLRNNPALRGSKVFFDGRLGVDGNVADVSGYYDLVQRDVTQLMTKGGNLSLAANEILARQGSVIDLSGGSLHYLDGYVRSTQLIGPDGRRVRIEDALAGVPYVGIDGDFVVSHSRWGVAETFASSLTRTRPHFERGYDQGSSAGSLSLSTNDPSWYLFDTSLPRPPFPSGTGAARVFDGSIVARTVAGQKQRAPGTGPAGSTDPTRAWREEPNGATLAIDRAGDVSIAELGTLLGSGFKPGDTLDPALRYQNALPASWFNGSTFKVVAIRSGYDPNETLSVSPDPGSINRAPGGHLTIGQGVVVNLGDGGSFSFTGKGAEIDGTLLAPGGKVSIQTLQTGGDPGTATTTVLGATGVIDVAGRFTNDHLDGTAGPLRALNGGSVSITAASVLLEPGSVIDVSGGASLNAAGTKLTDGNGGSITLDVSRYPIPGFSPHNAFAGTLSLGGELRGYALGLGGSLSIDTGYDVVIGDKLPASPAPTERLLTPDFFTHGGFSSYSIVGERGVTITAGTLLAPSVESLVVPVDAGALRTGTRLDDVAARQILPEGLAAPMKLGLSTVPVRSISSEAIDTTTYARDVSLEAGASIQMSQGSTVQLSSANSLRVDGVVEALGGNIDLKALTPQGAASIVLGSQAQLLAGGYAKTTISGPLVTRSVAAGGSITLGSVDLVIDPRAVLDVSGIHGVADLVSVENGAIAQSRTQAVAAFGDAGFISITASTGVVQGTLRLAPGGAGGLGGSLLINKQGGGLVAPLIVRQASVPQGAGASQTLTVVASSIDASGADDLTLEVTRPDAGNFSNQNAILFDGDVSLQTRRSISLLSPILGTLPGAPSNVALTSSYVLLHGASGSAVSAGALNLGSQLTVRGDLIDISNTVLLGCVADSASCQSGGFGTARFISSGDVRLADHDRAGNSSTNPGLLSTGALEFQAAQVYVASRDQGASTFGLERAPEDPGFLVQSDRSITIAGNGAPSPVPLSFGERLTLRAPSIVQGGVLRAPAGQLRLEGTGPDGSVTLLPGSLTSASLEGTIVPFGIAETGGVFLGYDQAGQAPSKSIKLSAPVVSVQKGAIVDVSGGGDLLGFTFVPGNGGSRDILSGGTSFAVLPSLGTRPAPIGPSSTLRNDQLRVGDTVFLQGVPGLADGYYTLLPAHYALLPGGLLVQPLGGSSASALPTETRPDGAVVASGYLGQGGVPGYGRFLVMSQESFGQYSNLITYSFDERAVEQAAQAGQSVRTPYDAGSVVLSASKSLTLLGTGRFGAGRDGLLGNLDISAPEIAVLGAGAATPDPSKHYLVLDPQALSDFGAGSVLLGGIRSTSTDPLHPGTLVVVNAGDVYVDTAGAPWTGSEILLVAKGSVTVADGSIIRTQGTARQDPSALILSGDGALLRLSSAGRVGLDRTGGTGAAGVLDIGAATLSTDGSLSLDGSRTVVLSQSAVLAARQLDLASVRVNLGDAPVDAPGITLGTDRLAQLASASDLLIRGYDSIDLYGNLTLGGRGGTGEATLKSLTLDTGLLQGHASAGGVARLTAGDLTLRNSGSATTKGAAGAGTLLLDVDTLHLGQGQTQLAGYGSVQGSARLVEADSTRSSNGLAFEGDLALSVGRIQASSAASYNLSIGGSAAFTNGPLPGGTGTAPGLGGSVSIEASSLYLDTAVLLPAGSFSATATQGGLRVGAQGSIDVHGLAASFQDQVRYAPGGSIRLVAAADIAVDSGALLEVSGDPRGGDAGFLELTAGGNAILLGTLRGKAAAGFWGGAFSLDAGTLGSSASDFSLLNRGLAAGGFDTSLQLRLRHQDLLLGAGEKIVAHEVVLRSDSGRVTVAGEIDAAGTSARPDGGKIELIAGNGISIEGTAKLLAQAGAAAVDALEPASGKVELVSTGGRIDLAFGSVIDLTGGRRGGGSLLLRARQDGNDVAVDRLGSEVRGARELIVIGERDYAATVVDAALVDAMLAQAAAWLSSSQANVQTRLGGHGLPPLQVGPGIVVTSSGDLSIAADLDLSRISLGRGAAGYLGLVASGNLDIKSTISDGFASAARDAGLLSGRSFSYGFQSGGDLTLEPGAMVRTGTGEISLHAGRDLQLVTPQQPSDLAAVVYTAGAQSPAPGFLGVPGAPGEFPIEGGDLDLSAGRDILAPLPKETSSAWLFRSGNTSWTGSAGSSRVAQQGSWSIVFKNFEQGVGALGGGDVRVRAGRDVRQLSVALPTTGYLVTPEGAVPSPADLITRGGGDLTLSAGRDIRGGLFLLGRGRANLRAGGSVTASDQLASLRLSPVSADLGAPVRVGVLFGLMDATASVTAVGDIYLEGIFDPMREGQVAANLSPTGLGSAFSGFTSRTAFAATSVGGSVRYENDPWAAVDLSLAGRPEEQVQMSGSGFNSQNEMFSRAPPTLRLTSLQQSVFVEDHFGHDSTLALAPDARGTLELFAGQDVHLSLGAIKLDDLAPAYLHGPLDPFAVAGDRATLDSFGAAPDASTNSHRGFVPLHRGDLQPVRIIALAGSVCAQRSGACTPDARSPATLVSVPKPLEVFAGRDVMSGNWQPQNNGPGDISVLKAGRDLYEPGLQITGEGSALLEAGRDVVLLQASSAAKGGALYSLGNRTDPLGKLPLNQALSSNKAADLYILAGTANKVNYDAFAAVYLDPANGHQVPRTYLRPDQASRAGPDLVTYLTSLGMNASGMTDQELVAAFQALPLARREIFLDRVYFFELKQTGIDYNDAQSSRYHSYDRGFAAVSLLFPQDPSSLAATLPGDVLLDAKPVETQANADITILAPYGRVAVGAEVLPANVNPASGGVVTRRGGDIRIMSNDNIDLFTSRVFSLQGGDVTMWTTGGSITAGAGSKTSVFQRPLTYTIDAEGVIGIDAFGLQTGAGIGVLDALTNAGSRRRSRLDLIAPRGEVNAGDAGIRVVGDINIAALVVVGVDNIQATGTSGGVPRVEAPNLGVLTNAVQTVQAATSDASGAAAQSKNAALDLPSIITVEVVGYETTDPGAAPPKATPAPGPRKPACSGTASGEPCPVAPPPERR